MDVEASHVREWMLAHDASSLAVEESKSFERYLEALPWAPSHVDWRELPSVEFELLDDWEEMILDFSQGCPLGRHEYVMVMYDGSQPSILCGTGAGLRDLDLLYSAAPGARYFCGVDLIDGRAIPRYEDFAEFDGFSKVTFRV